MLIHITPKHFNNSEGMGGPRVELLSVVVPEFGLRLVGGKDVVARKPYPNKRYLVACRKQGQKAISGLLLSTDVVPQHYCVETTWTVDGQECLHRVLHTVLDSDFDLVSDHMLLWHAYRNFATRWPACYTDSPAGSAPMMMVRPSPERARSEFLVTQRFNARTGVLEFKEQQCFQHSLESARLDASVFYDDRMPDRSSAFEVEFAGARRG